MRLLEVMTDGLAWHGSRSSSIDYLLMNTLFPTVEGI